MRNILFLYKEMLGGGAEKVIFDIAKEFNKNDSYKIILASHNLYDLNLYKECNLKLYDIEFNKLNILSIIKNIKEVVRICKDNNISIIHSHHRLTTVYALIVSKFIDVELVHTEHNVFPNKNWVNLRGKNIIAVSENVRDSLIKNKINKKHIKVIYNGIDLNNNKLYKDLKNEYGIEKEKFCFGTIARLTEQKGIFYLLKAFKEIVKKNENTFLFLIGDGELREDIEHYIIENNLRHNIIMVGKRADIMDIISSLDCYILPSIYEGFPITNLEVMSSERIVIATNVGGNKEIIVDGVNGYLVDPKNIEQLKSKLEYVLNNRENLMEMNKNARHTIEKMFNLDNIYKEYLDYYNSLFNG